MFMLIYALCYLPGHIVLGIIIPRSRRWRCPAAHICSSSCFCTRAIFRRRTPLKSRISYAPWKILRPRCPYGLDNQRGADPREVPAALSAILSDNYIISRDKKFPQTPRRVSHVNVTPDSNRAYILLIYLRLGDDRERER